MTVIPFPRRPSAPATPPPPPPPPPVVQDDLVDRVASTVAVLVRTFADPRTAGPLGRDMCCADVARVCWALSGLEAEPAAELLLIGHTTNCPTVHLVPPPPLTGAETTAAAVAALARVLAAHTATLAVALVCRHATDLIAALAAAGQPTAAATLAAEHEARCWHCGP